MHASRKGKRRLAACSVLIGLLAVSHTALLASNTVPKSFAGTSRMSFSLVTLTVDDAKVNLAQASGVLPYYKFIGLAATLTIAGVSAPEGSISSFAVNGHQVCTGETDKDGHAKCKNPISNPQVLVSLIGAPTPSSYTATFGDLSQAGSLTVCVGSGAGGCDV